jgi:hypothetical protein
MQRPSAEIARLDGHVTAAAGPKLPPQPAGDGEFRQVIRFSHLRGVTARGSGTMNDDRPQSIVARGYDRVAEEYARLESGAEWPRLRWLDEVLRRLPDGSR